MNVAEEEFGFSVKGMEPQPLIIEIDSSPVFRNLRSIKEAKGECQQRPKSTGRPVIRIPHLATSLESAGISLYKQKEESGIIEKCKSIVEVAKSYRKVKFNASYLERLERQTFSRPKAFVDFKDRVYLSNSTSPNRPLLILTFDGVLGFSQLCPTDETFEERLYVRRDLNKNLSHLAKMFNLYIILPAELRPSHIIAFIESLPTDMVKRTNFYQI